MSESIWVIVFVGVVYGGFYFLAHKAEKIVKAQAKQRMESQQEMAKNGQTARRAQNKSK